MGNIKNYNFNNVDFKLSNSDYYDFFLNNDAEPDIIPYINNLIASFNFSGYTSLPISGITSNSKWIDSISSNFSATTFGLTGLDNGNISYDSNLDDYSHNTLLGDLTGTTLVHTTNDDKLELKAVSGATGQYIYPIKLVTSGSSGNYIDLCGGFYQGYYKIDGENYQTMPNRYKNGWSISTLLKPNSVSCTNSGVTLNDIYPNNKGFFFYMGTRAENKFWNIFTGNTSSNCTSGSTNFCMNLKETDIDITNIVVGSGITTISTSLSPPPVDIELITNGFLIFGRSNGILCSNDKSKDGFGQTRAQDYDPVTTPFYSKLSRQEITDTTNGFLIFGRSNGILCSNNKSKDGFGQTRAQDYSGSTRDITELDKNADIIDNALGFRIKDDGSIGYRLVTLSADCKTLEIVEEYSKSGVTSTNEWNNIVVKWSSSNIYDNCNLINDPPRVGKYKFYVNSNLVFVSKELNEIIPKRLYDLQEKQIGVPYNISVGGGTQGLIESMTFDGQDSDDLGLIIENNFAGSFIGSMKYFNFYNKALSWVEIKDI